MKEKIYTTSCGVIQYWVSEEVKAERLTLVMLPGLTADHRLFEKQIPYFQDRYNLFVWDAPGHAASRPFSLTFSLMDKARWLDEILTKEGLDNLVIIGQSMGAYVGQAYQELFPGKLKGFVSIDSAPLQRSYITAAEIWMLRNVEPVYRMYPWKALIRDGAKGCATTPYGRQLMADMMLVYDTEPKYYCQLTGHGYKMLADAMAADLPYKITCPAQLICGEKDVAGSTRRYNKKWTEKTKIPLAWVKDAGHNSNTDQPEEVNQIIQAFLNQFT